jgi:Flp pilus assembly pilin Flp
MVSYLIVLALVVLVCVTAAQYLGGSISNLFGKTGDKVQKLGDKVDKIKVE